MGPARPARLGHVALGADRGDRATGRLARTECDSSRRGEPAGFCQNGGVPTREQIVKALEVVIDPELRRSIVELEMVRSVEVGANGVVDVTVSLTTAGCPIRGHFQTSVAQAVGTLEGVAHVNVFFDVLSDAEKAALRERLGRASLPEGALAQVRNVVCVGSGKGGVGKSTLTANLAAALSAEGRRAGVLDADVWGYSIPRMYGLGATRPPVSAQRKIVPLEAHGVKVMSIGFFVEEDAAVVWRGPMLHKALSQFLQDVEWGELDHLLIDLPPGTGDVSMTLAQLLPQARFVIVTTPQPTAQRVARRSAEMAHKVSLEVAGVIENMSGFTTPTGERYQIFGEGGGQELADELEVPLLGKIPLTMPLREHADSGRPLVLEDPDDPAAQAIRQAARGLIAMAPLELPVLNGDGATNGDSDISPPPPSAPPVGMSLPMA
jgi:ATP-binding protein involved in chromosome partitioning